MSAGGWARGQLAATPDAGATASMQTGSMSREMHFEVDRATCAATAAASGEVSASAFADLGALLRNSLADGYRNLVLDLTHCTDFPPYSAGLLNRLADEAHAFGGRLTIHGVPSFDAMMMRADGLAEAIAIVPRDELRPIDTSTIGLGETA